MRERKKAYDILNFNYLFFVVRYLLVVYYWFQNV